MLMSIMILNIFITLNTNMKKSWEMMIILINLSNITILMTYPLTDSTYMISNNHMLDLMSMIMLSLTMWIITMMLLSSFKVKNTNMKQNLFMLMLMSMLMILIMAFSTSNLIMFYIWFESSLIPTALLIIMWGNQPERKSASFYIILYTVTASLPMLMMFMKLFNMNYSLYLLTYSIMVPLMNKYIMFTMLMLAFLVKLPMFSLHLWLPKAHVEAPLAGSMILAAILLKLGGYGLMRMNKMLPMVLPTLNFLIISIASIGAIFTNIMCLRQVDLKSLIAYSSIGHMSLLIIGVMSNSKIGQYGSMVIMLTHGLTSSCLFLLSNMMYEKMHSRNIMLTNSLMMNMPMISLMWMLVIASNMALPPMLNIIGETMIMMTSYSMYKPMMCILMMMMFSTSLYSLYLSMLNIIGETMIMMTSYSMYKPMMCILMMMMFSTSLYSLYLYTMMNHGNSLKLINPMTSMMSVNLTSTISHLWPLLLLMMMPTKMMLWC